MGGASVHVLEPGLLVQRVVVPSDNSFVVGLYG
jgi:hypothetical protein